MLCGDEEGNVWIYDVRHILTQQQPPLPAAPQAPTQVRTPSPLPPLGTAAWSPGTSPAPLSPIRSLSGPSREPSARR